MSDPGPPNGRAARALHERLTAALDAREPVAVGTVVRGSPLGAKLLVLPEEIVGGLGDTQLDALVAADARRLLREERSETRPYPVADAAAAVEVFLETFPPPPTLLIFGAVHVAQALCRFAKALGFDVVVTDARAKLATPERFPEADRIIRAWPDEALEELTIAANTYVAILTHDPKFDEPALLGSLETPAAYVGAVGSRSTNRDRRRRLLDAGLAPEQLARVRGPIGLDIGADTPEEMAISILAEIIAVRHGRAGGPLTEATGPIRGRPGEADGATEAAAQADPPSTAPGPRVRAGSSSAPSASSS
ncbi:MAG: Xanthine and CO dehydrogenases maturation factor, XdhC/CoxF family [uncultured Thermomicrobiales bacterium]|uniref:Xanthine and CO dehydrogenases maturation factor, XdhC/CoxF family n=1 Tax=uncultured Thermomicrobiales bacterium TaxID=1645740 RepID=A0A6J4VH45_9BACT|nr:MAG: Xanthine and CO dehydrogenases maturation factor, XdhC/CoxF family [uncultured Thermomicrobiales bacterium]